MSSTSSPRRALSGWATAACRQSSGIFPNLKIPPTPSVEPFSKRGRRGGDFLGHLRGRATAGCRKHLFGRHGAGSCLDPSRLVGHIGRVSLRHRSQGRRLHSHIPSCRSGPSAIASSARKLERDQSLGPGAGKRRTRSVAASAPSGGCPSARSRAPLGREQPARPSLPHSGRPLDRSGTQRGLRACRGSKLRCPTARVIRQLSNRRALII